MIFKFLLFVLLLYLLYKLLSRQIVIHIHRKDPPDQWFRGRDITGEARITEEKRSSDR